MTEPDVQELKKDIWDAFSATENIEGEKRAIIFAVDFIFAHQHSQSVDVEVIKTEFKKAFRGDTAGRMHSDISKRINLAFDHLAAQHPHLFKKVSE